MNRYCLNSVNHIATPNYLRFAKKFAAGVSITHSAVSVRTPVLSHDGSDLAAALQTILEIGDSNRLRTTISKALPGRSLVILSNDSVPFQKSPRYAELTVGLQTDGCERPLKFLCLAASLLSPRPTTLIALNEPESSLHPDLLPPLAELIVNAAKSSQIWVSTHSQVLADAIQSLSLAQPIRLQLVNGETIAETEGGN